MGVGVIAAGRRRSGGATLGPAPSSTQWREYYPLGDLGWGYLSVNEIDARATSGGADQFTGGTATASDSAAVAGRAFDNNSSQYWFTAGFDSPGTVGEWLQYTTPSPISVAEWRHVGDATGSASVNPEQIQIQYYDTTRSAWVTAYTSPIYTATDWQTGNPPEKTYTFTDPSFSTYPTITNNAGFTPGAVGDTYQLSAFTYSAGSALYQWKLGGTAISGATSSTYTSVSGDSAAALNCEVTLVSATGTLTYTASIGPIAASPTYTAMPITLADTSSITLADASDLEISIRTA